MKPIIFAVGEHTDLTVEIKESTGQARLKIQHFYRDMWHDGAFRVSRTYFAASAVPQLRAALIALERVDRSLRRSSMPPAGTDVDAGPATGANE